LPKRYLKALSGAIASEAAFESISESATADCVKTWAAEEAYAQQERAHDVKAMDIYDIKNKDCE
jgi:hypothetical protein